MKLTRCIHNHYYDGSKYTKCPHCIPEDKIQGSEDKVDPDTPQSNNNNAVAGSSDIEYVSIKSNPNTSNDSRTTDFINGGFVPVESAENKVSDDKFTDDDESALSDNAEVTPLEVETDKIDKKVSLKEQIDYARNPDGQDTKTVAFYDLDTSEPVVGWLVALCGAYMGESFNLKLGRNNIGRWTKMDVALPQEASVSRDRHAILTFDPMGKKFYIQPGDGGALVYLNQELLLVPAILKDCDVIQLGECKLLFKSLCNEMFSWDAYLKGEK